MNQNLINQYEISFVNKLMIHPGFSAYYRKVVDTNMPCLTNFLLDWPLASEIEEFLIPEIDKVLDGIIPEFETGSETFNVVVGFETTVFYIDDVGTDYPEMPTQDFRAIVSGWKNYLEN